MRSLVTPIVGVRPLVIPLNSKTISVSISVFSRKEFLSRILMSDPVSIMKFAFPSNKSLLVMITNGGLPILLFEKFTLALPNSPVADLLELKGAREGVRSAPRRCAVPVPCFPSSRVIENFWRQCYLRWIDLLDCADRYYIFVSCIALCYVLDPCNIDKLNQYSGESRNSNDLRSYYCGIVVGIVAILIIFWRVMITEETFLGLCSSALLMRVAISLTEITKFWLQLHMSNLCSWINCTACSYVVSVSKTIVATCGLYEAFGNLHSLSMFIVFGFGFDRDFYCVIERNRVSRIKSCIDIGS